MLPPAKPLSAEEQRQLTPEAVAAVGRLQQEFRERMRVAYALFTKQQSARAGQLCAAYKQIGWLLDRPTMGVVRSLRTMASRPTISHEIATVYTRLAEEVEALYGDR